MSENGFLERHAKKTMRGRAGDGLEYPIILFCLLYFIVLYIERTIAAVMGFVSDKPFYSGDDPAQWYSHMATLFALLTSLTTALALNGSAFRFVFTRSRADFEKTDYRYLSVTVGLILIGGMAHTEFTLLWLQFIAYGFLLVSLLLCAVRGNMLRRSDVSGKRLAVTYLYLSCLSMAIPVVYGTELPVETAFVALEAVTALVLIAAFSYLVSVFYRSGGLVNFGIPVILFAAAADTTLIVMRASESLNLFVAVFLTLTIIFWLIGRIAFGNKVLPYFGGRHKRKNYFEGWYIKLTDEHENALALIISYHAGDDGRYAMIQITGEYGFGEKIPSEEFYAAEDEFYIRIGNSYISREGMIFDYRSREHSVCGRLRFGPFASPRRDIMGPFASLPFMECKHGIVSVSHTLSGEVIVDGKIYSYGAGSRGYIEKDLGGSFPSEYMWTQGAGKNMSVIAAVAKIPYFGARFPGCICLVTVGGREYRLATYNFAHATVNEKEAVIVRGKYTLRATRIGDGAQALSAPVCGDMRRIIYENPSTEVRYVFKCGDETVAEMTCRSAGWENG